MIPDIFACRELMKATISLRSVPFFFSRTSYWRLGRLKDCFRKTQLGMLSRSIMFLMTDLLAVAVRAMMGTPGYVARRQLSLSYYKWTKKPPREAIKQNTHRIPEFSSPRRNAMRLI